jgi:hypothetical protein
MLLRVITARLALCFLAVVALTSCATPWPSSMPPTTYAGTIENQPRQKPEPDARIVAVRPETRSGLFDWFPIFPRYIPYVSIGETVSGKDGRFVLTTTGGYATKLLVQTQDHRMVAVVDRDLKRSTYSLRIEVLPEATDSVYHVAVEEADVTAFGDICDKLMYNYAATGYTKTYSLGDYRARGVITAKDYALLLKLKPDILGPNPGLRREWATLSLRITSFDQPVRFIDIAEKKWFEMP